MNWEVIMSSEAADDLEGIVAYITDVLGSPIAAQAVYERIRRAIRSLESMPFRFQSLDGAGDPNLRRMPVDRYMVLYRADEKIREVSIVRIMYGSRDIIHILGMTS